MKYTDHFIYSKFNLTHLSFMNVTSTFKILLGKGNCFDSFYKLIGIDVESVYIFWYFYWSHQKLVLTKQNIVKTFPTLL